MTATIGATEFKQRCLEIIDTVGPDGLIITKHGRPVAKLTPMRSGNGDLIGILKGELLVDPDDDLSTGSAWDSGEWGQRAER
jgi:prevent-host-death family protein